MDQEYQRAQRFLDLAVSSLKLSWVSPAQEEVNVFVASIKGVSVPQRHNPGRFQPEQRRWNRTRSKSGWD